MAKITRKKAPSGTARNRTRLAATERSAFPGGAKKDRKEVQRVVPPARA
jgi:hypothetical protein